MPVACAVPSARASAETAVDVANEQPKLIRLAILTLAEMALVRRGHHLSG